MKIGNKINRRSFVNGGISLSGLVLAGCTNSLAEMNGNPTVSGSALYGALPDEKFAIPAVNLNRVKKKTIADRL